MIKVNPFTPNSPVHKDMFAGRKSEIDAIDKALLQTAHGNPTHLLLLGERGIGKTSLLNAADFFARGDVLWEAERKHNFLVSRVSLNENITLVDLAISLKNSIERELDKEYPQIALIKKAWNFLSRFEAVGISYKKDESNKNNAQIIQDFIYSLSDTLKLIQNKSLSVKDKKDGLVILIDEADKASKELFIGSFLKNLTETLVRESNNNILFIVSGLPNTRNILSDSHESSLRLFQEFDLGPLSSEETSQVINNGLKESKKTSNIDTVINKDALISIYAYSEGYPHFVQQIGYSVFEADTDNIISIEDVKKGVFMNHGALELIGDRYYVKPFYKDINVESQREILTIMAEKWNDWIKKTDIQKNFSGKKTALNNGLRALKEKGIIIPREGYNGQYRLQWASFAFWIKNHKKTERRN
ncbi:AAA family ATPase [Patescibacteria group bacterium]|nr:AAA family ATPase [Patescibacteria group bacterium]